MASARPTLRSAFAIAWPASLAAAVTPLLGVVDMAVLARGGTTADVAGVALAGAVISVVYWTLGFLRMSLAGLVAQADGRADEAQVRIHLVQGVMIGAGIGLLLLIFRGPIIGLAEAVMGRDANASPEALSGMAAYLSLRLLAAPFAIGFMPVVGWLSGQGRTGAILTVVTLVTGLNAGLDAWFVLGLDLGVEGIAIGTALAEGASFLLIAGAAALVLRRRGGIGEAWDLSRLTEGARGILALNVNIFLRTFLLALTFAAFARAGAQFGDTVVAANQVLMNLVLLTTLFLDGPAIAAESLVGRALGRPTEADRRADFAGAVRATAIITGLAALALTIGLLLFQSPLLALLLPEGAVAGPLAETAARFMPYVIAAPIILAVPFFLDGLYIGATRGPALRNSMAVAAAFFAITLVLLDGPLGNHGLWLAFFAFMAGRAVTLLLAWGGFARLLAGTKGTP